MPTQVKRWGSVAILTTIFTGLAVAVIFNSLTWAVSQITDIKPMVDSVDKLSTAILDNQKENASQHIELSAMIYQQNARMEGNEAKLFRVMQDCKRNNTEIDKCKEEHNGL